MRQFHEQLDTLLQRIVYMGSLADRMVDRATTAVLTRNMGLTEAVFTAETEMNGLHVEIDDTAVRLTALQQPVARDVRFLFMASKIGSELERVGDQACNIAQNTRWVLQSPPFEPLPELAAMADAARGMVRDSLVAMVNRDVGRANRVLEEDNKVDAFRDAIFKSLLGDMGTTGSSLQRDLSLILIARNLERIGDHATNIAEEVIYWIQGRDIRHRKGLATAPPPPAAAG